MSPKFNLIFVYATCALDCHGTADTMPPGGCGDHRRSAGEPVLVNGAADAVDAQLVLHRA
jgi:hypothetical protein